MRLILLGAGGVTRELLRRLGDIWEPTVVDVDAARLDRLKAVHPARTLVGDGSSRIVLERAGLSDADALIAATSDDDVNLEACRLAREAEVVRIGAVARRPERFEDYRRLGVAVESPQALAARRLELSLESRRLASMAFAGGRAEAIELRIAPDSPVRGRKLRDLAAESYIVGVILRGDELIVPHGETVLEAGDLVTIVGRGAEFAEIVRTFTGGTGRFPMDYGKRIAVALAGEPAEDVAVREALDLVRNTRASALVLVHRDPDRLRDPTRAGEVRTWLEQIEAAAGGVELRPRPIRGSVIAALLELPSRESIGTLVLEGGAGRAAARTAASRAVRAVRRSGTPVLLARGSQPYRRIVVPARRTSAGRAAARAAIDLARFHGAPIEAISVTDPEFLAGSGAAVEARHAIAVIEEEAAVLGVAVHGAIERGNPVIRLLERAREGDLLVVAVPRAPRTRFGRELVRLLAARWPRSVLLVPSERER